MQSLADYRELREQTALQGAMLESLRDMVGLLRSIEENTLRISNGVVEGTNAAGAEVRYVLLQDDKPAVAKSEEEHYLRAVIKKCDPLDLTPIDETQQVTGQPGSAAAVNISDVFTKLFLSKPARIVGQSVAEAIFPAKRGEGKIPRDTVQEVVPIQAVEAIAGVDRLVVLGEPGGGKSTLVNHVCAQLARWRLSPGADHPELEGWHGTGRLFPVRIILRRFAASLPAEEQRGDAGLVWSYLESSLCAEWGCEYKVIRQALLEKECIVFFDGLDEVSEQDAGKRSRIMGAIKDFASHMEDVKIVVTCRPYAYERNDNWRLPDEEFPVVSLDLFRTEQMEAFTSRWYEVLGPSKGWDEARQKAEAKGLFTAVRDFEHLNELARYPLLLTMMAQLHGKDGSLPDDRADLYERVVVLLLATWQNRIVRDVKGGHSVQPSLILELGLAASDMRDVLARVAFLVHERQEAEKDRDEKAADIPKLWLLEEFNRKLDSYDEAARVLEFIQQRAALLIARDSETYAFPHKTFQEYLAAVHILKQARFDEMLVKRIEGDLTWWREVFLLAAVKSSRDTPRNLVVLVKRILKEKPLKKHMKPALIRIVRLLAQALHEAKFASEVEKEKGEMEQEQKDESGLYAETMQHVQAWLEKALVAKQLPPKVRADAGNSLAVLGDSRKAVMTLDAMDFCMVPAGPFMMGSSDKDEDASSDEKPLHTVHLDYDYWMSRFPVTNAQYQYFVKAGGYKDESLWCKNGWSWNAGQDRKGPHDHGKPYTLSNHPVVGVTWYEMQAFTIWLTRYYKEKGWLQGSELVMLPSEAEWEKAARGGLEIPRKPRVCAVSDIGPANSVDRIENTDSERIYCWKGAIEPDRLNYKPGGIGVTSTVGCFPAGKSPYGVEEMLGNVWEWSMSGFGHYPYEADGGRELSDPQRDQALVLRGGSFDDNQNFCRCAYRLDLNPDFQGDNRGFRLVVLPLTMEHRLPTL